MTALQDFLARNGGDLATLRDALGRLVADGAAFWFSPDGPPATRPATHMHEISAFGVTAHGTSADHAVDCWRIIARRQVEQWREAEAREAELTDTLRRRIDGAATVHAIESGRTRIRAVALIAEIALAEIAALDRGAAANLAQAALLDGFGPDGIDARLLRDAALDDLDLAAAQAARKGAA